MSFPKTCIQDCEMKLEIKLCQCVRTIHEFAATFGGQICDLIRDETEAALQQQRLNAVPVVLQAAPQQPQSEWLDWPQLLLLRTSLLLASFRISLLPRDYGARMFEA
ncbi:hypothetical protein HPB47_008826 [Ixodes persulcatus]|uniref:Uncharacterized protein n=1 Tax=Ixodes persulcatus TaxID=34615 RepID=A0AC60P3X6_IXOPE|nr:hypothetical protein HPB47_008826 [Ixodes persulcatus]